MNIAIVGTGYVGLVSGVCFAEMGANVWCVDVDSNKIENLKRGISPIYEPNLEELLKRNLNSGRLNFSTNLPSIIDNVEMIFLAVGTPPDENGNADLRFVFEVAKEIGKSINKYTLVITKSTVPVGTSFKIKQIIEGEIAKRGISVEFDVASNPEFLKEGSAVEDFMRPDRVVIGVESKRARKMLESLYRPMLINNFRVIFMDIVSAEMTKYVANAMLATRISFMNEMANLCEKLGASIDSVRSGIASDLRIGSKFLYAGCGYGGSCFPKDVKAIIQSAKSQGVSLKILEAVEDVNESQKKILFQKFLKYFNGKVEGKHVAIWGLSFKPNTDDMREAPSLVLIDDLLKAGCKISVYDPIAMSECKRRLGDKVKYAKNIYDCAKNADAIFHITEWKEFRMPDWNRIKELTKIDKLLVLDGRNVLNLEECDFIDYIRIG